MKVFLHVIKFLAKALSGGSAVPWYRKDVCKLYCNQALSSWGDRMWSFAVAMYLATLSRSLRLTAVYGFTTNIAAIVCCPAIGKWIDHTPRLRAARTAIVLQNFFVATCAALLCVVYIFLDRINLVWLGVAQGGIIIIAVLADLASLANKLSISKDWVPVIAKDSNQLSHMNAMIRRIDLTTLICAPIVTGQLMTYSGGFLAIENSENVVPALCIAGWNLFSVFIEYRLVTLIYRGTPDLAHRKQKKRARASVAAEDMMSSETDANYVKESKASTGLALTDDKLIRKKQPDVIETVWCCRCCVCLRGSPCITKISLKFNNYVESWKIYFQQDVLAAGIGLSLLYMTVLGFDSITLGYAKLQGVSESILGGLSAIGAVVGILGTLAYPLLRSRLGIERTGLYGFFFEVVCLTTCVVSIWVPGSPFEPEYLFRKSEEVSESDNIDRPKHSIALLMTGIITARFGSFACFLFYLFIILAGHLNHISSLLMTTSFLFVFQGLWMADLTVNQILQERVDESCRGTVFGVQSSLNSAMNTLKFILVIGLPHPKTFGYLIVISFIFICSGWIAYCVYSCRQRGHLLPLDRWRHPENYRSPKPNETPPELPAGTLVS